ncbi:unnamed protein product [Cochlearia groenlandica]
MEPKETNNEESHEKSNPNSEEDSYDEYDESESSDDESESSDDDDGDSIVDDGDSTDDKPEWGVDSCDESNEYCSPDEDAFSEEEIERKRRLYRRNLHFSHGFLVEKGIQPPGLWNGSIILKDLDSELSPVRGRTQLQYAEDMAKMSLRKYNLSNETSVKLDHVVRVTESFCGTYTSYITFMARENEDANTLVEYQAKVSKKPKRKTYPIFCRPSPKQDQDM